MTLHPEAYARHPLPDKPLERQALPHVLYGHHITLLIDGRPVSLSSLSTMNTINEQGIEEITLILNTTKEAIKNPSIDAAIQLLKGGFDVGQSAQVRFEGQNPTGVVFLDEFDYEQEDPEHSCFIVRALTPVYSYDDEDKATLMIAQGQVGRVASRNLIPMPETVIR